LFAEFIILPTIKSSIDLRGCIEDPTSPKNKTSVLYKMDANLTL